MNLHLEAVASGPAAPDDPEPVARAYTAYAAELRRFAGSRLPQSDEAEDVVQESFLRLAVEADAGRFPRQPRAWLYRVAINHIISGARRRRSAGLVAGLEIPHLREPVDSETPETLCLAVERRLRVGHEIASVGQSARTGMLMAAEGYSGREIAFAIGRTETATRGLMCRARAQVRRSLEMAEAV